MSGELPESAEVRSTIIWFEGYDRSSPHYMTAIDAGGFVDPDARHVYPAALEETYGDRVRVRGRRVGIDVTRRAIVIDVAEDGLPVTDSGEVRVLINLQGFGAAHQLALIAIGEAPPAE